MMEDHWISVSKAAHDAHAGAQSLAKAAEEVRLVAERSAQEYRIQQARQSFEDQRVAEQWRLLAEERERLAEERTSLEERAVALQAAEQRHEEKAALLQRLRKKGQMTQRCGRCNQDFIVSENGLKACKFHTGRWVQLHTASPKTGPSAMVPSLRRVASNSVLQSAAGAILNDIRAPVSNASSPTGIRASVPQQEYHWSCCGSKDQYNPGCQTGAHHAANLGLRSGQNTNR